VASFCLFVFNKFCCYGFAEYFDDFIGFTHSCVILLLRKNKLLGWVLAPVLDFSHSFLPQCYEKKIHMIYKNDVVSCKSSYTLFLIRYDCFIFLDA